MFRKLLVGFRVLQKTIVNGLFISTHQLNDEELSKSGFLWTEEEKRKCEIDFETKSFITMSLDDSKFNYVHHCKISKEMWDTLKMIYEALPSIKQEEINTRDEEDKDITLKYFSKLRNIGKYVGNCITNKYLRVKNWKFNPTLKLKYGSLHEFQKSCREVE